MKDAGAALTLSIGLVWRVLVPRATVVIQKEKYDLETLPGGWVELRRLTYGEKLAKDAEAMRMKMAMDGKSKSVEAEVAIISEAVTLLEFAKCITNHNLTKEGPNGDDVPLDFRKAADVQMLDPRVGDEISGIIGKMNDFDSIIRTSEVDSEGK